MTSESSNKLRAQALNPETPLGTLLKLIETFPDEVIENPAFTLMLLGEPSEFLSGLSKAGVISLLLSPKCPSVVLSQFEIVALGLFVYENTLDGGQHWFGYEYDDLEFSLIGTIEGELQREITLSGSAAAHMARLLGKTSEDKGFSKNLNSFINIVANSDCFDGVDSHKDYRCFSPPHNPEEATLWSQEEGESHTVYRNPDDERWAESAKKMYLDVAIRFFADYDNEELDYESNEYMDSGENESKSWNFKYLTEIKLAIKGKTSKSFSVDKSDLEDGISLNDIVNLLPPTESPLGILIQAFMNIHHSLPEETLDSMLEQLSVLDSDSAIKVIESNPEVATILIDDFFKKFEIIKNHCNSLGVLGNGLEILVGHDINNCLFPQLPSCKNTLMEWYTKLNSCGTWIDSRQLLNKIRTSTDCQKRLARDVISAHKRDEFFDILVRMKANCTYVPLEFGVSLSEDICSVVITDQCLPMMDNEFLCGTQGFEEGEYDTGIIDSASRDHICKLNSLIGTVWEGLHLD